MLTKIALLFVLAASAHGFTPDIKVRYGILPFDEHFIKMAKDIDEAINMTWVKKDRPTGPAGLESLELWCPAEEYSFCTLFDDNGYAAGVQIAVAKNRVKSMSLDAATTGFTSWTTTLNGTSIDYYTKQLYFISADNLTQSKESRVSSRNSDKMLQYDYIWLSGFNGELYPLPLNASLLGTANSDFTKQACIPWMGQHYYYKMSEDTQCTADAIFPWFPLVSSGEIIGMGFMALCDYEVDNAVKDYFEHPAKFAVQAIVNSGPTCLYDLADNGTLTMHVYFVDRPRTILCLN